MYIKLMINGIQSDIEVSASETLFSSLRSLATTGLSSATSMDLVVQIPSFWTGIP